MPGVTQTAPPGPQALGVLEPEGQAPLPDRFVRDGNPALREEILDVPKTEAESVVQPHGVGDDLGWKTVSAVAGRMLAHPFSLPRELNLTEPA